MLSYNPAAWYWTVAGNAVRVWSSAAAAYVPVADATYVAWLAAGGVATRIDSEASLADVLAQQYPAGWPPSPVALALAGPLAVTCSSMPTLNGAYAIDTDTQAQITSIAAAINAGLGLPGGGTTFEWPDMSGTVHPWPAAQFVALAKGIMNYLYAIAQFERGAVGSLPSSAIVLA